MTKLTSAFRDYANASENQLENTNRSQQNVIPTTHSSTIPHYFRRPSIIQSEAKAFVSKDKFLLQMQITYNNRLHRAH